MCTNDCVSHSESVKMCKFADDTTLIGLITDTDNESDYRNEVSKLIEWSYTHNLKLKVKKTKEIMIDFRQRKDAVRPLTFNDQVIENVDSFLGTIISAWLKLHDSLRGIIKKSH